MYPGNICSLILVHFYRDHVPAALERPEGISDITHALGTWPYAQPLEGMDPSLIDRNGQSDFYALDSSHSVQKPADLSASVEPAADGSVHLEWTMRMQTPPAHQEQTALWISRCTNGANNVLVSAYGNGCLTGRGSMASLL